MTVGEDRGWDRLRVSKDILILAFKGEGITVYMSCIFGTGYHTFQAWKAVRLYPIKASITGVCANAMLCCAMPNETESIQRLRSFRYDH